MLIRFQDVFYIGFLPIIVITTNTLFSVSHLFRQVYNYY